MAKIILVSGATVDANDFWVKNGAASTQERFEDQTSLNGSLVLGIGNVSATYNEFVFERGDFTFHYVGEWNVEVNGGVLASSTSASGKYDKVVIERNGEPYATLVLDEAVSVNFGTQTGIDLLGLGLDDLTNPLLSLLLGNSADGAIDNLHLNATPDLTDIAADAYHTILGNASSENINGTSAGERIDAKEGNDIVNAGGGNDVVYGRTGNDKLSGEAGDDTLVGGAGADQLNGGSGTDTASYVNATSAVVANLRAASSNAGEAKGDTYTSIENLRGTNFNDSLVGNDARNRLDGGSGNDQMFGMNADDTLVGGEGSDKLVGGLGADQLFGGFGADTFIFVNISDSIVAVRDMINDFSRAEGDKIDLSAIDARETAAGDQAFTFVGTSQFSGTAGELRYSKKEDTYVYGDVNGDGNIDLSIRLDGSIDLASSDFIL
ncbi:type I secretion C-terminal target domain-containing protein [Shinella curvata]|uniref:Type I secretion C-terminal target domain-containing protein n=1 Tax=Shinella curvata TaxID=1817964 RepID=A0ABT8XPP1_9HYPH|nr:type I secretion C-terminal target domain-containing protein [Shinella curvata]MCJ8057317.1 type I secretion C-terminal target domain-containing protein [Shinella curvata]MDO6125196.1 type I secretion C-terminal target domain-containing protein [Shinella curvata]